MNKTLPLLAMLTLLSPLGLVACEDDDVGIPCNPAASSVETSGARIDSKAMDCRSRLCLVYGSLTESRPLCTKTCSDDGDCPDEAESCKDGFRCIPATETGGLACCKVCVCKRYIPEGSSGSSYCDANPPDNCPDM